MRPGCRRELVISSPTTQEQARCLGGQNQRVLQMGRNLCACGKCNKDGTRPAWRFSKMRVAYLGNHRFVRPKRVFLIFARCERESHFARAQLRTEGLCSSPWRACGHGRVAVASVGAGRDRLWSGIVRKPLDRSRSRGSVRARRPVTTGKRRVGSVAGAGVSAGLRAVCDGADCRRCARAHF